MKYTNRYKDVPWHLHTSTRADDAIGFEVRTAPGDDCDSGLLVATVHHQDEETFGNAVLTENASVLFEKVLDMLECESTGSLGGTRCLPRRCPLPHRPHGSEGGGVQESTQGFLPGHQDRLRSL